MLYSSVPRGSVWPVIRTPCPTDCWMHSAEPSRSLLLVSSIAERSKPKYTGLSSHVPPVPPAPGFWHLPSMQSSSSAQSSSLLQAPRSKQVPSSVHRAVGPHSRSSVHAVHLLFLHTFPSGQGVFSSQNPSGATHAPS